MSSLELSGGALNEVGELRARLDLIDQRIAVMEGLLREVRQLVGPFGVLVAPDRLLVQTLHGVKFLVDPADLIMTPQLIVYRQWEPELSALLNRTLTADSVFVDVGANFGYFTCLAGARIGAGGRGRVIAVEPNPAMLDLLSANLTINWSMCPIQVERSAAGPHAGTAQLWTPLSRAANASLSPPEDSEGPGRGLQVPIQPLDSIVPAGLAVDVLKVDVEGHETGVLMGARRVIEDSPGLTIILEWSQSQMAAAGYAPKALLDLIAGHGFQPRAVEPDGVLGAMLTDDQLLAAEYANLVFQRPGAP